MSTMRIAWGICLLTLLVSLGLLLYVPEGLQLPVHWGLDGQPDRYGSAMEALLMPPGVMLLVLGILSCLKWLEPRQKHLKQSLVARNWIGLGVVLLMLVLELGYIALIFERDFSMPRVVLCAIGLMFLLIGNFLPKTRSNFFVGIRTPWTLSSDENWRKTHRLGGRMFMLAGALLLFTSILSSESLLGWGLLPAVLLMLVPVAYSWWLWRRSLTARS